MIQGLYQTLPQGSYSNAHYTGGDNTLCGIREWLDMRLKHH